jgi:tetratricopeptide (TPR) repeat protein
MERADVAAALHQGDHHALAGRAAAALGDVRTALALVRRLRVFALRAEDDRKRAEAEARARYSALVSQGNTDSNAGDYDRAIADFNEAIRLAALGARRVPQRITKRPKRSTCLADSAAAPATDQGGGTWRSGRIDEPVSASSAC